LVARRERLAVVLWRICGLGGIGAIFGGASVKLGVEIEPAVFVKALRRHETRRRVLVSFLWHGVFLVFAEVLDRRHRVGYGVRT
jgi:hypothetical protein